MQAQQKPEPFGAKCEVCGRVIWSLYPKQAAYLLKQHRLSHEGLTWNEETTEKGSRHIRRPRTQTPIPSGFEETEPA